MMTDDLDTCTPLTTQHKNYTVLVYFNLPQKWRGFFFLEAGDCMTLLFVSALP